MSNVIVANLGIVGMKPCGEYDNTRSYEKLNIVSYEGSSYCAKGDTIGHLPTDSRYWTLLVEKGGLVESDIVDNLTSDDNTKVLSAKQGKVLKELADKKVYFFDNVASMKLANLFAGDFAVTKGYYSANDGGDAIYEIVSSVDSSQFQEVLNNNLRANLIINDKNNVKQFGAKGDGTTIDTDAIRNAFKYCKKVNIPNGTYLCYGIQIYDGSIVSGESSSILKLPSNLTDNDGVLDDQGNTVGCSMLFTTYNAANNITIANLILDGNGSNLTNLTLRSNGIMINKSNNINIHNVTCQNFKGHGCYLKQSTNAIISDSRFNTNGINGGSGDGLCINYACNNISVNNCVALTNDDIGFEFEGRYGTDISTNKRCSRLSISNCIASGNKDHNYLFLFSDRINASNLFSDNCQTNGLNIVGCKFVTVNGFHSLYDAQNSIIVQPENFSINPDSGMSSGKNTNIYISDVTAEYSKGINLKDSENVYLKNGSVQFNQNWAHIISNNVSNLHIDNFSFNTPTQRVGIRLDTNVNTYLKNCSFGTLTEYGVSFAGGDIVATGLTCDSAKKLINAGGSFTSLMASGCCEKNVETTLNDSFSTYSICALAGNAVLTTQE